MSLGKAAVKVVQVINIPEEKNVIKTNTKTALNTNARYKLQ